MTTTTTPRPDGLHRFSSDRGTSSITRFWDDGSDATVSVNEYAGRSVTYRPAPPARERSICWPDNTAEINVWLRRQRPRMPDHIWEWLRDELPPYLTEGIEP